MSTEQMRFGKQDKPVPLVSEALVKLINRKKKANERGSLAFVICCDRDAQLAISLITSNMVTLR